MATTPNYGWVTPAPTDFVTDLPADFEIFADAVDADLAGLLGGTAGQVLVKNSGTDHDFDFAVDPVSDLVTTAGDVLYGSAADTLARLGIGTAGQLLTVNSGATAPEWTTVTTGAMTEIATGSLTGASVTISSIPATFRDLRLVISNFLPATDAQVFIRFNSDSTSYGRDSTVETLNRSFGESSAVLTASNDDGAGNDKNLTVATIAEYANTTTYKWIISDSFTINPTNTSNLNYARFWGFWNETTAINALRLAPSTGNFTSGTYTLYGVK
jgi:hypothetical protein